jgi:hypothetical protein
MIEARNFPLALDNVLRVSLAPSNSALNLPATVTSATDVTMAFSRIRQNYTPPSEWWNGSDAKTIGTSTDEITTTDNKINIVTTLDRGTYRVRGDITIGGVVTPWINGALTIGKGMAQFYFSPLGNAL